MFESFSSILFAIILS